MSAVFDFDCIHRFKQVSKLFNIWNSGKDCNLMVPTEIVCQVSAIGTPPVLLNIFRRMFQEAASLINMCLLKNH